MNRSCRLNKGILAAISIALPMILLHSALACEELTAGKALFQNRREMHSLCLFANSGDPQADEIYQRLESWSVDNAEKLNVKIERVTADDPAVAWDAHGMTEAPETLPQVVLVARHAPSKFSMVADAWTPAPSDEELALVLDSPLRQKLRADAALNLCVIVFSKGAAGDTANLDMLKGLVEEWETEKEQEIVLIELDRNDPHERMFIQFTDINEEDSDWAAVFAGRALMLFPPFRGEYITRNNIIKKLEQLNMPCTCILDPRRMGVEIPIIWDDTDEALASTLMLPLYAEQAVNVNGDSNTGSEDETALLEGSDDDGRFTVMIPLEKSVPNAARGVIALAAFVAIIYSVCIVWRWKRKMERE